MTDPGPLADQLAAANATSEHALAAAAAALGGTRPGWVEPAGSMRVIIDGLTARLRRGDVTLCRHLSLEVPCQTFWATWAPGRIRCSGCTEAAARRLRGTAEVSRCDVCRRRGGRLAGRVVAVSEVLAQLPGLRGVWPPIIVYLGVCHRCDVADDGASEEAPVDESIGESLAGSRPRSEVIRRPSLAAIGAADRQAPDLLASCVKAHRE